ncbi:uncharacterized protein VTP21DRAFT_10038 [Calcarisporiella thermophila]|uniref:uncharacterized protein n=1 Tax=Calcarisporiella thermophila TaxID=911321 RepID=UPI00374364FF
MKSRLFLLFFLIIALTTSAHLQQHPEKKAEHKEKKRKEQHVKTPGVSAGTPLNPDVVISNAGTIPGGNIQPIPNGKQDKKKVVPAKDPSLNQDQGAQLRPVFAGQSLTGGASQIASMPPNSIGANPTSQGSFIATNSQPTVTQVYSAGNWADPAYGAKIFVVVWLLFL